MCVVLSFVMGIDGYLVRYVVRSLVVRSLCGISGLSLGSYRCLLFVCLFTFLSRALYPSLPPSIVRSFVVYVRCPLFS